MRGERRRAGKKKREIERSLEIDYRRGDFKELQESRKAGISLGKEEERTLTAALTVSDGNRSSPTRHLRSEPPSLPQIHTAC